MSLDLQMLSTVSVFRTESAKLLASGHPSRRVLKEISKLVDAPDAPRPAGWLVAGRAPFLYHLARALGLVVPDGNHLRDDGNRAAEYFLAPATDRTRQRVRAWRGVTEWTELCDLVEIELDGGARARAQGTPSGTRGARGRARVFDAVGSLSPTDWTPVDDIIARIREADPTLLFPAETGPYYPGVARREGALTRVARRTGWDVVEGAFVRRVLETLQDLGAVELRRDGDRPDAVQPTAQGLYALGTGARPGEAPTEGGELVVQPTFEVVVLSSRVDVSLVFTVERFAARTGPGPGTTYRIDEASVYRAVREGMEIPEIAAFLEAHAKSGVPSTVSFALKDWARRQDRIRFHRRATVVEFPDAESLEAHLVAMEMEETGARRVGDRFVLLPTSDRRTITRCLGQNYFADLDYAEGLAPCVRITPELEIVPIQDKRRLDLDWQLSRFCEVDEGGRFHVTAASLRAADARGMSGAEIQDVVEALAVGGVSPELRLLADATSGNLGAVALGSATVLVVENPAELDRLVDLHSVSGAILRVLGGGVALVRPEAEETLRAALRELGVSAKAELLEAPGTEPGRTRSLAPMTRSEIRNLLDRAVAEQREVVLRYDPGARQPLQELRVAPQDILTKNGVAYLVARQTGRREPRRFSLNFVRAARLLGGQRTAG